MKKSYFFGLIGFAIACSPFCASAQEFEGTQVQILGINAGGGEMTEEMRAKLAEGAASFSFASPGGTFSIGSPMGGVDPNNRSQLFNLLANQSIRNELKLTEDQFGGVQQILKESQNRMSEMVRGKMAEQTQAGSKNSIRLGGADFRDLMKENQAQAEAAIEEILLPEQLVRVRQLAYQVEVSQEGLGESLVNGRLGSEIGVHNDQKQHLTDKAVAIEANARAAIAKIRTEARAQLLAELTPEQRKAATALLGNYFEYEEPSLGKQLRSSFQSMRTDREAPKIAPKP